MFGTYGAVRAAFIIPRLMQSLPFCHRKLCLGLKNKNRIDATNYFIVRLIGSTCFGHYYAHHQELVTMMLITTLVVSVLVCCMLEVRCG